MLKIKDEIPLDELEKFGFRYDENELNENPCYIWDDNGFYYVWVKNRKLDVSVLNNLRSECDLLYDLITAGLVEKVEEEIKMANCKGCGAEIVWITTKNGKQMPCNAEKTTIVTENGETISGHIPHWATCPKFKDFKKEK